MRNVCVQKVKISKKLFISFRQVGGKITGVARKGAKGYRHLKSVHFTTCNCARCVPKGEVVKKFVIREILDADDARDITVPMMVRLSVVNL